MRELVLAECIDKQIDDKNIIIRYKIMDVNGNVYDLSPSEVKDKIRNNELDILNLKLTEDGRLIEIIRTASYAATIEEPKQQDEVSELSKNSSDSILDRAREKKLSITELPTECGKLCYWIKENEEVVGETDDKKKKNKVNIIYIPDDVTVLNNKKLVNYVDLTEAVTKDCIGLTFTNALRKIKGSIRVVGGKGLKDASYFFAKCKFAKIDLSKFDSSNVTDMEGMFAWCSITVLNFAAINVNNVVTMNNMFRNCKITRQIDNFDFNAFKLEDMRHMFKNFEHLNLNICDLRADNVKYVHGMFENCRARRLNIQKINVSRVEDMSDMFKGAVIDVLEFTNYDTYNVKNMNGMFMNSKINSLNVFFFATDNVIDMGNMFRGCTVKEIDLLGFNTLNVINMSHMFEDSKIKRLDLSSFRTNKVEDMSFMFKNAKATEIIVKNFRTPRVRTMEGMFYNVKVKSLSLIGFSEESLETVEEMFCKFSGDELDISNLDIAKIKNTTGMFNDCNLNLKVSMCVYEDEE